MTATLPFPLDSFSKYTTALPQSANDIQDFSSVWAFTTSVMYSAANEKILNNTSATDNNEER